MIDLELPSRIVPALRCNSGRNQIHSWTGEFAASKSFDTRGSEYLVSLQRTGPIYTHYFSILNFYSELIHSPSASVHHKHHSSYFRKFAGHCHLLIMSTQIPTVRALLIGINDYKGRPRLGNLSGCVADITKTQEVLENDLGISNANITRLTSPPLASPNLPDGKDSLPTKANIFSSMVKLSENSDPGDFMYIHFSGHGGRDDTKYPERKGEGETDECLCALDEDILDVEFGKALDAIAARNIVLFVVLDSCHSGGATRHSAGVRYQARCKDAESFDNRLESTATSGTRGSGQRNVAPIKTWHNIVGDYNFIAACQPHEYAYEVKAENGVGSGYLTTSLLDAFKQYKNSKYPITYQQLISVLQANLKAAKTPRQQQPMHLGDQTRVVFGTAKYNDAVFSLSSSVDSVTADLDSVHLSDGNAAGININDCFSIFDPAHSSLGLIHAGASPVAKVQIKSAQQLTSTAQVIEGSLADVQNGWLARLSRRAHSYKVNVKLDDREGTNALLKSIQNAAIDKANDLAPLDWEFRSSDKKTTSDFSVSVDKDMVFRIQDRQDHTFPHLPLIEANDPFAAESLVYLLQHLSRYCTVRDLETKTETPPLYEFVINKTATETVGALKDDQSIQSSWEFVFRNKQDDNLYISILNVNPAYGIEQIYPAKDGQTAVVDGQSERRMKMKIMVPDLLTEASKKPGFRMEDRIKVFITKDQASFSHYHLDELKNVGDIRGVKRNVVRDIPQVAPWYVEDHIIVTPSE